MHLFDLNKRLKSGSVIFLLPLFCFVDRVFGFSPDPGPWLPDPVETP